MGILAWLFGRKDSGSVEPRWARSDRGNFTATHRGYRATVFEQDGGWKYVFADEADQGNPYFSERFESEAAARRAAMREFGF